jgi:HAE1 family hydrophobic/amphiphilic exporter-1
MSLADLSIKRPVFITAIIVVLMVAGFLSLKSMPVDQYPDVTLPIVTIVTPYPGAGPEEVETLISKILEEELSTVTGIKTLRSENTEGYSTVIAEFTTETDVKYAEQQVRDKVSTVRAKLPTDITEPVIRRIDPADQPIVILGLQAPKLNDAQLYDLANDLVKPKIEQVNQVGKVEIVGGTEREIHVSLDRKKLNQYQISATAVAQKIAATGQNIPAGKVNESKKETSFRTLGQYQDIKDIGSTVVSFYGNDVPVTVNQVGKVLDTVKDETSRAYSNGQRMVFIQVYRQSGANTIAVADSVKARVEKLKGEFEKENKGVAFMVLRDGSKAIRDNVADVKESIFIGIALTIFVVYFFLGSGRSTFITGLSLPTSLIGAFLLMSFAGFTINIMSLLALSLAVGLLIDDAIVVRENIFRHVEMGKSPVKAASDGTKEVMLAVIATTFAVVAVFAPIGFLKGTIGQFFKQFGLTVVFAMLISLFDALTTAPMLSAYFAGGGGHGHGGNTKSLWGRTMGTLLRAFDQAQTALENLYAKTLKVVLRFPLLTIGAAIVVFILSLWSVKFIPKTFLPPSDTGEFMVTLEAKPGTNLSEMTRIAQGVDKIVRDNKEVSTSVMSIGGMMGEANKASFFIQLVPSKERHVNTTQMKDRLRDQLKPYAEFRPAVMDAGGLGQGQRPFTVNILGNDLGRLQEVTTQLYERLKNHPALTDVDVTFRTGKPEFQVVPDKKMSEQLGVLTSAIGSELRTQVEGSTPAVFRQEGKEYDIRVRLEDDQRNLRESFNDTFIPNVNGRQVRLRDVAKPVDALGPAKVTRQDRGRYFSVVADIKADGPGMSAAIDEVNRLMKSEIKLDPDMRYVFVGQAESFQELIGSVVIALVLGILFIYLVLASLYESFVTPFTIMLVLPLAVSGAFAGLVIMHESLSMFSMIGVVMLLGVATKNSILLVDYANQMLAEGMDFASAITKAGVVRLRPILMTSIALIAGMIPIAIGLNEASKQRTGMGVAVIGGVISSTLLSLIVVPAAFTFIERFRRWSLRKVRKSVGLKEVDEEESENQLEVQYAGGQLEKGEKSLTHGTASRGDHASNAH